MKTLKGLLLVGEDLTENFSLVELEKEVSAGRIPREDAVALMSGKKKSIPYDSDYIIVGKWE